MAPIPTGEDPIARSSISQEATSTMPDEFDFSQPRRPIHGTIAHTPFLTALLCIISVVVTAAFFTAGSEKGTLWWQIGHAGYGSVIDVWNGRYTALITNIFIHASLMHIIDR